MGRYEESLMCSTEDRIEALLYDIRELLIDFRDGTEPIPPWAKRQKGRD